MARGPGEKIATGVEKLAKTGVDTIFFLTDGMPNAGQIPVADNILVKVKELNKTRKVKINSVGVFSAGGGGGRGGMRGGNNGSEADQGGAFLKKLAEENDGKYTNAGGAKKP